MQLRSRALWLRRDPEAHVTLTFCMYDALTWLTTTCDNPLMCCSPLLVESATSVTSQIMINGNTANICIRELSPTMWYDTLSCIMSRILTPLIVLARLSGNWLEQRTYV